MDDYLFLDDFIGADIPLCKPFDDEVDMRLDNGEIVRLDNGSIVCRIKGTLVNENE